MCAASVPDSALSASSLPVIYLQAFLTFPLAFPSFLPSFLSFLFQLFSFLSNISASYLFFALLLRVSLLCPFCPVVSFLPSFFLLFSCPSSLIFFLSFFHLFFLPHPSLPSFLMPLFTSFFHCILLALLPSSLFLWIHLVSHYIILFLLFSLTFIWWWRVWDREDKSPEEWSLDWEVGRSSRSPEETRWLTGSYHAAEQWWVTTATVCVCVCYMSSGQ